MKRYASISEEEIENAKVDAFLQEIADVSRRHGLALGHEDVHGAFKVHHYEDDLISWLMNAYDATGTNK